MRNEPLVKENLLVSPFLVFFLIIGMQVGVGILGFEKYIAQLAGYDSWIVILVAGLSMNGLIFLMFRMLKSQDTDLIGIHSRVFGKWLGGVFSMLWIGYFLFSVVVVLRSYTEIVQVWMFPQLPTWAFGAVFLILAYFYTAGGFRTVAGIAFLSFIYGIPLIPFKMYTLEYAEYTNLLPMLDVQWDSLLAATREMTLSYIGAEFLLMYYPFIKERKQSEKWAHFGALFTMFLYLSTAVISFVYFSEQQLLHVDWATLNLWKIVSISFIERFEYVGVAIWMFVVLPNLCLGLWCASRGVKRLFGFRQKTALLLFAVFVWLFTGFFEDRIEVKALNSFFADVGFYTLYRINPCILDKISLNLALF